jgi:hypothetical protein
MPTPTKFVASRVMGSIPFSNTINAMNFTAAGVKTQNVPTGANLVIIQPASGQDVFVALGATPTAAVPPGDVTNGTASMQDPSVLAVTGMTEISVATATAGIVTLSYYS